MDVGACVEPNFMEKLFTFLKASIPFVLMFCSYIFYKKFCR